ncbi:MAG TPA: glycosyltransferase family 1 protein [Anaerolineae bacterium]|jgi:glycosyltransferase involved in cell wall biosynthesis|nr:glycosyltransferase family 1 protein [Anaerolineae bacterium]
MHVAINAHFWNRANTGSGQYTRQLVYYFNRLVADLEITLIYPLMPGDPGPQDVPPSVKVEIVPVRTGHVGKVYFEQVLFPRACRKVGADVAHVPYWGSPLQSPIPLVVTVHDVTTLLVRDYHRGFQARLYNGLISAGARAAAHVITDSMASKKDIVRHLNIPAGRVTPIYLAVESTFTPETDFLLDMAVRKKYDLPDFYVLYLGGYEIHKNVTTLLLAYTYVAQALGDDYPLVLAGAKPDRASARFPDYDGYVNRLDLEDSVIWTGYIDEQDKPALYRGASAFVFISRHEGFGLPALEAMACGVPLITSDRSSLPEVVGDAAFTLDPDDDRQIGGSIIAAVMQEELAAEMREKGLSQAANFSWEKTATETLLIYDKIVSN